jgi:hypothetical protein
MIGVLRGSAMAPLPALVMFFPLGIALGYGVRALISKRRRNAARRRYIATGSHREWHIGRLSWRSPSFDTRRSPIGASAARSIGGLVLPYLQRRF